MENLYLRSTYAPYYLYRVDASFSLYRERGAETGCEHRVTSSTGPEVQFAVWVWVLMTMKFRSYLHINMAALLAIYISVAGLYALDIVKKIPASRKYSVNSHRYRFGTPTLISRKSLSFAVSSTRRDNSDEHQGEEGLDDGKFLKLGTEIVEPFGPLGLVIAGFNKEEYLDLIIDAFDKALPIGTPLPVAILGKSDIKKTFREVLSELQQWDCLLPADGEQLSLLAEHKQHHGNSCDSSQICYLRYPLVLCSGFQVLQLQVSFQYGFAVKMSSPYLFI